MMDNYDCPEKILGNSDDDDDDMLTPPTRTYLFFYSIDCFIARSTICYLKKTRRRTKTHKKNNALESLLPSPSPKVGHPKLVLVLFKDLITRIKPD